MKSASATLAPPRPARVPDRPLQTGSSAGSPHAAARSDDPHSPAVQVPALQPIVIQFGRFGDMVMLSPVLQLLHRRFGRPCLVLAAGPWNGPLYQNHPDVAAVWCFPRYLSMALTLTWWRAVAALRARPPGPVYVCERQPRQEQRIRALLRFSRIDPLRCLFITDQPAAAGEHWVDRLLQLAARTPATLDPQAYPVPAEASHPAPRLCVTEAERIQLRAWLAGRGWHGRTLILIQPGNFRSMGRARPGAVTDDKAWPVEHWVALLRRVHERRPDALLVLCGAPQEAAMLEELRLAAALPQVVAAELPMRSLLALCESAESMISVDTGPAHAAAALGLPLVVLFGSQPQSLWLPRSPTGSQVIGIGGPPRSMRVDAIPVDEVFAQWSALGRGTARGGATP